MDILEQEIKELTDIPKKSKHLNVPLGDKSNIKHYFYTKSIQTVKSNNSDIQPKITKKEQRLIYHEIVFYVLKDTRDRI